MSLDNLKNVALVSEKRPLADPAAMLSPRPRSRSRSTRTVFAPMQAVRSGVKNGLASANPLVTTPAASYRHRFDGESAVAVTHATKRYRLGKNNHVDALRGASIEIARGEMVAIVGPSGSGKSTMMHMVGCLDRPDSGRIYINGRRVDNLKGTALTRVRSTQIGFIFQGFNLVSTMSATDNVALAAEYAGVPRKEALERAAELLDMVGLGERKGHIPSELSGGQQQRVAIARALINRPALVLGDEPTGDLDTATSAEIVALMRRINAETGTTFVIVTHNPEVAESCDRTIRMRDGQVEDDGLEHTLSAAAPMGHQVERCCPAPALA